MAQLEIVIPGDGMFQREGIDQGRVRFAAQDARMILTTLEDGMEGGGVSIGLTIQLPDGTWAHAETSLKLWVMAAEQLVAHHGYPDLSAIGIAVPPGEMRQRVIDQLAALDLIEQRVMTLRFGLDSEFGTPRSVKQVAEVLGLDPGMVAALERRAAEKLNKQKGQA